jgi:alanyl-tRNA synthetase
MLPERQTVAPAEPPGAPLAAAPPLAPSTADAVDRILAYTESAVASIVRRTEHQVREIAAEVDARATRDATERSSQLGQLRRELTERASALAVHYEDILNQLDAVEAALAALGGESGTAKERQSEPDQNDARIAAIKMTLRERQRISVAYEASTPAVIEAQPQAQPMQPIPMQQPAPMVDSLPRRRWWHLWHREAA